MEGARRADPAEAAVTSAPERAIPALDPEGLQRALEAGQAAIGRACEELSRLADRFGELGPLITLLSEREGHVVVTGLGKSGLVGAKLAATLASTGTPSFFVHSADALHGDSGCLTPGDVLFAISKSGETAEVVAFASMAREWGVPVVAITGCDGSSSLARVAVLTVDASIGSEADPWDIVPTASTSVVMMLGDALAISLMIARKWGPDHFGMHHPGGSLGQRIAAGRTSI